MMVRFNIELYMSFEAYSVISLFSHSQCDSLGTCLYPTEWLMCCQASVTA